MIQYKKANNITGWAMFGIATLVYLLTVERTASFWDCGEFIAASYKLQVPHPPGAPFFLLIGRLFSLFAPDVTQVAYWINLVSVLSSAFTILFLFWTITYIAKKLLVKDGTPDLGQTIGILGSGIVGALAYTFSDSFWFSAVEAEVYAISSFFTAFVVWAILKWEEVADDEGSDRWLLLIAYVMGLSIGAHLLNLVTIPALAFVFYFKRIKYSHISAAVTFVISIAVVLLLLDGVIAGLPSIAGKFEVFFVNTINLPVGAGIVFFVLLFVGGLSYGILYANKNQKRWLHISLLAFAFILIGYMSYGIIVVRSQFNPPIDENNPENIISFVSYLKREQYGDRPLFYGPQYNAEVVNQTQGAPLYRFDEKTRKYVIYDHKLVNEFDKKNQSLIPRIWSRQPGHIQEYTRIVGLQNGSKPTFGQNLAFMFKYQFGTQFFRYFGWNFVGRESDIQGADVLTPFGNSSDIPESLRENKARNNFYFLPLVLGILGLVFHYYKDKNSFVVVTLLFILTGLALSFYLNQPPIEPRERDYIFVGAYYAFAIWIGFGVLGICEFIQNSVKNNVVRPVVATLVSLSVPGIMLAEGWDDHNRNYRYISVDAAKNLLNSCAENAVLFTGGDNDTFPLWYVQEVEGFRTDVRVCNLSLLNTDWYIDQMKTKAYKSQPLPITLANENYIQGKNDYLMYDSMPGVGNGIELKEFIELVRQAHPAITRAYPSGTVTTFPTDIFNVKVNRDEVIASGIVPAEVKDFVVENLTWSVGKGSLEKKDLIILDMIANNNWKRPIYFSTTLGPDNFIGLKAFMQLEGLAYRLLPVRIPGREEGRIDTKIMKKRMTKDFFWRGLDDTRAYYDENSRRFPMNARSSFQRLSEELANEGKMNEALEVIDFCLAKMPDNVLNYDYPIAQMVPVLLKAGKTQKAIQISDLMVRRAGEELKYLLKTRGAGDFDIRTNMFIVGFLAEVFMQNKNEAKAKEYNDLLNNYRSYFPQQ